MIEDNDLNKLLCVASKVKLPDWATHVAVRTDGSKAEPAAWLETASDYVDEDPAHIGINYWAGSYKHCYWKFFSRDELKAR